MLDPKYLRNDIQIKAIAKQLATRAYQLDVSLITRLEARRKELQIQTEALQNTSNRHAKSIGSAKAKGECVTTLIEEVAGMKTQRALCERAPKDSEKQ